MCTLISFWDEQRLLLGMNRDNPPERVHRDWQLSKMMYPVDPVSGGTWIAVMGSVVAALLYGKSELSGRLSRGQIVPYVLEHGELPDPEGYGSFQLFVYDRGSVDLVEWNGFKYMHERMDSPCVLASSSYGHAKARESVLGPLVREADPSVKSLQELLRTHLPEKGPASACMHGVYSRTIASTIVDMDGSALRVYDLADSPCENEYATVK